jgi:hypothetical protein
MLYAVINTVNNQIQQSIQCAMINTLLSLSMIKVDNAHISQCKDVYSDQVTVYHKVCCMQ